MTSLQTIAIRQCCAVCDDEDWKLVRTEPEGQLVRCAGCKFLYVYPRPTAKRLKALYDDEYFSHSDLASCLSFRIPVFQQCLRHLDLIAGDSRRLLDVGCGTGEFVGQALLQGWDAVGIESSRMAAEFASEHNHLPVYNAVLESAPFDTGVFDVVTLLDVLEHLLNPRQEMKRVHELLKPGGIAVVRVPNTLFHLAKAQVCSLLGISDSSLEMRYHLNHFTPQTLSSLLRKVGFEVLSVEVGAPETKVHAAWANPAAKRWYVMAAQLLHSITRLNLGNIMVAYARKPA
jgi:2-polyprenyl-3-methyl-5-hydroxy-6-metoxy-1,4-benzoquinol methylase